MKKVKTFAKLVFLGVLLLSVSGCFEEQSPFIIESTIDLQNPNGIYEILLYEGAKEAFENIGWNRYKNKKVFYNVQEITDGYLDNVVDALAEHKFLEVEGEILVISKTGENKEKSTVEIKKETDYDYDVYITVPISGVYYYEGFFKRNYVACVMINIFEQQKDGTQYKCSSGIIERRFNRFIPSKVCIIGLWTLLLSVVILLMVKILFRKKMSERVHG